MKLTYVLNDTFFIPELHGLLILNVKKYFNILITDKYFIYSTGLCKLRICWKKFGNNKTNKSVRAMVFNATLFNISVIYIVTVSFN